MWACVGAWGCSQRKRWLIKHGDGLLYSLRTPMSSTQPPALLYTVYNMTVCLPLCLASSTLLSPHLICLCWGSQFVFVSLETFERFHFGGESFVVFCFLFLFCKAYDSYCIRASSNNKNSKKLLFFWFLFFTFYQCELLQVTAVT